jgi:chromosome segregation ATPase
MPETNYEDLYRQQLEENTRLKDEIAEFKAMSEEIEIHLTTSLQEKEDELASAKRTLVERDKHIEQSKLRLTSTMQENNALQEEVTKLSEKVKAMKSEISHLHNQNEQLERLYRQAEFSVEKLTEDRDAAMERAIVSDTESSEMKCMVRSLQQDLDHAREELSESQRKLKRSAKKDSNTASVDDVDSVVQAVDRLMKDLGSFTDAVCKEYCLARHWDVNITRLVP